MAPFELSVTTWPSDRPAEASGIEAQMKAEGLPYYRWSNGPGDVYGVHRHDYHKVIYVVSGSITFNLPEAGRNLTLSPGDRLGLPAGVDHSAVVGPEGVVCLEGHRPANELPHEHGV